MADNMLDEFDTEPKGGCDVCLPTAGVSMFDRLFGGGEDALGRGVGRGRGRVGARAVRAEWRGGQNFPLSNQFYLNMKNTVNVPFCSRKILLTFLYLFCKSSI